MVYTHKLYVDIPIKMQDTGVQFKFDGDIVQCRGTVTVFSADNLAAWAVGGFKALASAVWRCQFCMVTH